jgi:hypothetical protein
MTHADFGWTSLCKYYFISTPFAVPRILQAKVEVGAKEKI